MVSHPLTLAIEISNPGPAGQAGDGIGAGVALGRVGVGSGATGAPEFRGVDVLGVEQVRPATRQDDDLMPAVARLCARVGVEPRAIERVAVSVGPGGFTGLRVATATAQMLCVATGARCAAVPTACVVIRRASSAARGVVCAVGLAWKRDDAWRAVYEPGDGSRQAMPAALVRLESFMPSPACALVADAAMVEMLRSRGVLSGAVHVEPPRFDPVALLEASALVADIDPAALVPLYPREPEAVTKWREMRKAPRS